MTNKNNMGLTFLSLLVGVAVGFGISTIIPTKAGGELSNEFASLEQKDLARKLSDLMLPKEEYDRLIAAITQSGVNLAMSKQTTEEDAGFKEKVEKIKQAIEEHYHRDYFTDMNAASMAELTKDDLIGVLNFYATEGGQKFLKLSPQIIQTTMTKVQEDLANFLPKAVDDILSDAHEDEKK